MRVKVIFKLKILNIYHETLPAFNSRLPIANTKSTCIKKENPDLLNETTS